MLKYVPALGALLLTATPAAAQNMPLTTFVERGTALEKKGALALFERGEINALQAELKAASAAVGAEYQANKKAGRKQAFCPVAGQKFQMNAKQVMAEFRAIPAAQARTMTTKDAMRQLLAKRYPCR